MAHIKTVELLGYPVHPVSKEDALAVAENALQQGQNLHVVTLNPEMMMQGEKNPALKQILHQAGLILPDGAGVVWALKRQKLSIQRLPGIEFSEALLQWAMDNGHSVAIVGATKAVLESACQNLREQFPTLQIVYNHHGFFASSSEEQQVALGCAQTKPAIVLVALGVPRQELWIAQYQALFEGSVLVGIGGSLDVWSGKILRAPAWMRQLNLEWLYRITSEPWRIKRIYKPLPLFVFKVLLSRSN